MFGFKKKTEIVGTIERVNEAEGELKLFITERSGIFSSRGIIKLSLDTNVAAQDLVKILPKKPNSAAPNDKNKQEFRSGFRAAKDELEGKKVRIRFML